jgi:hypothetical protein
MRTKTPLTLLLIGLIALSRTSTPGPSPTAALADVPTTAPTLLPPPSVTSVPTARSTAAPPAATYPPRPTATAYKAPEPDAEEASGSVEYGLKVRYPISGSPPRQIKAQTLCNGSSGRLEP